MRTNKYRNTKVEYKGYTFDSKGELNHWIKLEHLQEDGEISNLQRQVKIEILPKQLYDNGKVKHRAVNYICDFVFQDNEGKTHYQDYKGMETPEFKLKNKLFSYTTKNDIEIVR